LRWLGEDDCNSNGLGIIYSLDEKQPGAAIILDKRTAVWKRSGMNMTDC